MIHISTMFEAYGRDMVGNMATHTDIYIYIYTYTYMYIIVHICVALYGTIIIFFYVLKLSLIFYHKAW